ncbi:SUN domain-containing protein 3 [Entomophthora muscae]|uniref:SUN domain-containing protein 3 n=1 Tax=Entomophthora muscae TaxID=34485 RepID=A0ACC2RN12_9FUNG|nr:SUN domain-containing protein 3 [Entomophthora muscae]
MILGAKLRNLLLILFYVILYFCLKSFFPGVFSPPGCTPSDIAFSSPKSFKDRLLFILVAPIILLKPLVSDIENIFFVNTLRLQSGRAGWKALFPESRTYTCIYNLHDSFHGKTLLIQDSQEHADTQEKIDTVKAIAIQAGLEVLDYDSLDKEILQANALWLKLKNLKSTFDETCDAILRSKDSAAKRRADLVTAAIAFYGSDKDLPEAFKAIKNIPNRYTTLTLDPQDPSSVILSDEFKGALVNLGVDPQKLLDLSLENHRSKFRSLRQSLSSGLDSEVVLNAFDFIESLPYFQGLALKDVSEKVEEKMAGGCSSQDVYSYWAMYSAQFEDEFFMPLSSAKVRKDVFEFLSHKMDMGGIAAKFLYAPENYALLDQWAIVDEHETRSSILEDIPELVEMLRKANPFTSKLEDLDKALDPRNAISPEDVKNNPWVLGTSGQLGIQLFTPLTPFYFAILSPPASYDPNPTAGVKEVEVWGRSTDGRHIYLSSFTRPKYSTGYDHIMLEEYSDQSLYFSSFQLVIKNNHGHPGYTKLYQFSVYGLPVGV